MRVIKGIVAFLSIVVCFVVCTIVFAYFVKSQEKTLEFGKEYVGMDYSDVIHKFGKEPDVLEKFTVATADKEFKNTFGSFIDSCNTQHRVIKFTYKQSPHDITLWAYDNTEDAEIVLVR